jgi:uncharacterized repeat protein (TIGR01451 family)
MKREKLAAIFVLVLVSAVVLVLSWARPDARLPISQADAIEEVSVSASVNAFKIASAEIARPGDLITYTIIAYNNDPAETVEILMVDEIPEHTAYVTHTIASRVATSGSLQLPGTGSLAFMDFIFLRTTLGERGTVFPPWVALATLTVRVEEDAPMGWTIVNRAEFWIGDEPQYLVREAETKVVGGNVLFLPLIMKYADMGSR